MKKQLEIILSTPLFEGIAPGAAAELLDWLRPSVRRYRPGELVLLAGFESREIGIVLRGCLFAERTTPNGERLPIAALREGSVFGDVLSGSHTVSPVTIAAQTECELLLFPHAQLLAVSGEVPAALPRLLQNLIGTISDKYFALSHRLDLLMTPRLRERVLLYLQNLGADKAAVSVAMTRTALAEYLGCNRAALARELARMQKEGLLQAEGRCFSLCPAPDKRAAQK